MYYNILYLMLVLSFAVKIFYNNMVLVEFCSLRIGPDWIDNLVYRLDWAGLDTTLAGLGPDWIPENESVSCSGSTVPSSENEANSQQSS